MVESGWVVYVHHRKVRDTGGFFETVQLYEGSLPITGVPLRDSNDFIQTLGIEIRVKVVLADESAR